MKIVNLYEEIISLLNRHNKTTLDIEWVGSTIDGKNVELPVHQFRSQALNCWGDDSSGSGNDDLVIVGKDWWIQIAFDQECGDRYWRFYETPDKGDYRFLGLSEEEAKSAVWGGGGMSLVSVLSLKEEREKWEAELSEQRKKPDKYETSNLGIVQFLVAAGADITATGNFGRMWAQASVPVVENRKDPETEPEKSESNDLFMCGVKLT